MDTNRCFYMVKRIKTWHKSLALCLVQQLVNNIEALIKGAEAIHILNEADQAYVYRLKL